MKDMNLIIMIRRIFRIVGFEFVEFTIEPIIYLFKIRKILGIEGAINEILLFISITVL